jgi:hypothetical protein
LYQGKPGVVGGTFGSPLRHEEEGEAAAREQRGADEQAMQLQLGEVPDLELGVLGESGAEEGGLSSGDEADDKLLAECRKVLDMDVSTVITKDIAIDIGVPVPSTEEEEEPPDERSAVLDDDDTGAIDDLNRRRVSEGMVVTIVADTEEGAPTASAMHKPPPAAAASGAAAGAAAGAAVAGEGSGADPPQQSG